MDESSHDGPPNRQWVSLVLRRADHPTVIMLLCVSWLLIGWFVVRLGLAKQGVIDIDNREPRQAQLQVDLNTAPWPEFATLPGVGEVLSRSIVDFRREHGEFGAIEDIKLVPGIGEIRFSQLRPYLVISNSVSK